MLKNVIFILKLILTVLTIGTWHTEVEVVKKYSSPVAVEQKQSHLRRNCKLIYESVINEEINK